LNINDDLGLAQLFGEASVVLLELLDLLLDGVALGFGAPLVWRERLASSGSTLTPPSGEKRRVQTFAPQ
jgi:hypothetical protein